MIKEKTGKLMLLIDFFPENLFFSKSSRSKIPMGKKIM